VIELAYAHMHACKLQALAMREDQIRDQVAAYGGICMQYGVSGSGDFCWKHKHFLAIFLLFFFSFRNA